MTHKWWHWFWMKPWFAADCGATDKGDFTVKLFGRHCEKCGAVIIDREEIMK